MFRCILSRSCRIVLLFVFLITGSICFYKYFNYIPRNRSVKIAIKNYNPPFNILAHGKNVRGFNVDVIRNFFDELGIKYEIVLLESDELISSINAGLYDIGIINSRDLYNKDNLNFSQDVLISSPYIESQNVIITKAKAHDSLKYKRIGVYKADVSKQNCEKMFHAAQILEFNNLKNMYKAFNSNQVDALLLNDLLFKQAMVRKRLPGNVNVISNLNNYKFNKSNYMFIFPKGSDYFRGINNQLNKFKNKNKFMLIYQKWFGNLQF